MEILRVFLSSPGDCNSERTAVHNLVARLNADPLVSVHTHFEVVAWDWAGGIPLDALHSPQVSVNARLPAPELCHVFIGIFRCRFGSPLPGREFRKGNGEPFWSGSEYEFNRAWEARRRGSAYPEILLYRWKEGGHQVCPDAGQRQRLEAFFHGQPFRDGDVWTGSVHGFTDTEHFSHQLEHHLKLLLVHRAPGSEESFSQWLDRQAHLLTCNAWPRYIPAAHVETEIGRAFDWLLARPTAVAELDDALRKAWSAIATESAFDEYRPQLRGVGDALRENPLWESDPDFAGILGVVRDIQKRASAELENAEAALRATQEKDEALEHRVWRLHRTERASYEVQELISRFAAVTQKRVLLLTGPAGQGKTHTVVHEVERAVVNGGVAVGVLGQTLPGSGTLWSGILECLSFNGGLTEFLDTLETEAVQRKQRALLVFDALNETTERSRWQHQLLGMLAEPLARPHLTIVLTARSDYLRHVLPAPTDGAHEPWVKWDHPGFSGVEPAALMRYFAYYGIKAPVAPPLGELTNPLYVQLLAKSLEGQSGELTHWLPSWLDVWRAWVRRLEQNATEKLALDPSRPTPIQRTLKRLAQAMLDSGQFHVARTTADAIAQAVSGHEGVIEFLCSAGALIDRLGPNEEDYVDFAYDRLTDTFLVDQILEHLFRGLTLVADKQAALKSALAVGGSLHPLTSIQWVDHPLYPRRAGLLQALCVAAPREVGVEFPALLPPDDRDLDWERRDAFVDSLRWRSRPKEFGVSPAALWELWQEWTRWPNPSYELDEVVRLGLIPGHPFALEHLLHPWLLSHDTPGARDAVWSIHLVPLWHDSSSVRRIVEWARTASLAGIHPDVALPTSRVLAWICATSQLGLREAAIEGLTRVVGACPRIMENFLPDFLGVNDAYVLEAVLVAVLGVVMHRDDAEAEAMATRSVLSAMFPNRSAQWCHLTIRHYARRIVEQGANRGWLGGLDTSAARPPYRSTLPFDEVPTSRDALEALDDSKGFRRIVFSSVNWDFFRYIISPALSRFSSRPMPGSSEPERGYYRSENLIDAHTNLDTFDLALAARFIAWNCRGLGWTADRFNDFDTGLYVDERYPAGSRTERIGKKYQWMGLSTLLAFLADNYEMRSNWDGTPQHYDSPTQVTSVGVYDPGQWLKEVPSEEESHAEFWAVPSLPSWPLPTPEAINAWVESSAHDLPPADLIEWCPPLPPHWGKGRWIRVAAEHSWKDQFAPGQWALGREYYADIWWQIMPRLVRSVDFLPLLKFLNRKNVRRSFLQVGRIDPPREAEKEVSAWPLLGGSFDEGFRETTEADTRDGEWFPVPWMPLIGESEYPDHRHSVFLPWPRLFREWDLELDLRKGIVTRSGEVLFGLAGWTFNERALMARLEILQPALDSSGYRLIWFLRGERRAFLRWGTHSPDSPRAWMDYHGIAFLGADGRTQTAWLARSPVARAPLV